jgi:hypothetical protein
VLRFFDWLQDETCRLLETGWPAASLVLAADEAPVGELAGRVLQEIGVD